jgi:phospholipid/cholesterol/gamma-HCH transport system substrate-binding protein
MQKYTKLEIAVGAFVIAGAISLAYLSVSLGGLRLFSSDRYEVTARFSSVGGLKTGDPVKISGVSVGEVAAIRLVDFAAEAALSIDRYVEIPKDSMASIQSNGLLGDAFVSLSPGADDRNLAPGERITRTEAAVSLTELIAKYAFGSPISESPDPAESDPPNVSPTEGASASGSAAAPVPSTVATTRPSPFADPLEE